MEDDDVDDLWGPPLVVKDDTFGKQLPLRGCEFWFDFRTDVLEESFQMGRYCELVWTILNEKKIDELGSPPDSDKTLSATLPDADTSSAKSSLDEDENTSSISDAQTVQTKDSTNDTEEVDPETNLKPQEETAEANEEITVEEVAEDGDTPCSPPVLAALASKIDEAEEHSCSSLVTTQQVFDPIQQATENKSPSAIISQEKNNGEGSTLTPERENAKEDGDILKEQQQQKQSDSLQDIETASEPFTTESLLEMCDDEPEKGREEAPSKRSMTEAVKTVIVKEEPIINMLAEARIKIESKEASLNPPGPVSVPIKKRKRASDCTSLIRNTKQKVGGGEEVNTTPTESKPKSPSVPPPLSASTLDLIDRIRQRRGWKTIMGEPPVILLNELHDKTGKELRSIAKELKITHYYKMKKEDLLQNCIMWLKMQLTGCCKEQRVQP